MKLDNLQQLPSLLASQNTQGIQASHSYLKTMNAGDLIEANGEYGALQMVSQQFEAQFLQTLLKQMRSASDVMADEDSPLSSQNDGLYRDWHDAELAGHLSQMQSMGLASVMTKQLAGALKSAPEAVASNSHTSSDALNASTHDAASTQPTNGLGDISAAQSVKANLAATDIMPTTTAMQPSLLAPLILTPNELANK